MASLIRQLNSQTSYVTDGSTTVWNFNFSGGYLEQGHVKAVARVIATGVVSTVTFAWTGPNQITISPALAAGIELTVYRDTPKSGPLVNFIDRANLTEVSLDYSAKQAIFAAAEAYDWSSVVGTELQLLNLYQAAIATGPVASVNGQTGLVTVNKDPLMVLAGTAASVLTTNIASIIGFTTKVHDTNGSASLSRFLPNVAGYYDVSAGVVLNTGSTSTTISVSLYLNGAVYAIVGRDDSAPANISRRYGGSGLVYLNGVSDYVEVWATIGGPGGGPVVNAVSSTFTARLARLA